MQDDRLALLNPLQGGLTPAGSRNSWIWVLRPSMTPHFNGTGFSLPPDLRKAAVLPIWRQLLLKTFLRHLLQWSRQLLHSKAGRTTAAPNTESWAVTAAKAGTATNSCCWLKYRVRLLLPQQTVGGRCCTEAGSKWYLAARQNFSHLWHHSPSGQGKMQQSKASGRPYSA